MATVTDRKLQTCGIGTVLHYTAQVVTISDYYPFGMLMEGREYSSENYRFGFNGYEREDDVSGGGSVVDFGARIYDCRLGRFFSLDPLMYPSWSPYQYDGNCPISLKDFNGMGNDDPDNPKPKRKYKDANGNSFLADDLKKVWLTTKTTYEGTVRSGQNKVISS